MIDEADLILSYGHDDDVRQILSGGYVPKSYQSFLMSATMTKDVDTLKGLALRNPVRSSLPSKLDTLIRNLFDNTGNPGTGGRHRTTVDSVFCSVQ